ncbi:hypothetical protein H0H93_012709, partial [Arthromyces matolae]
AAPITDPPRESAAALPPYATLPPYWGPLRLYANNHVAGHSPASSPPSQTIVPQDIPFPTLSGCNGSVTKFISAFVVLCYNQLSSPYKDGPNSHSLRNPVFPVVTSSSQLDDYDAWIMPSALYIGLSIAYIRICGEESHKGTVLNCEIITPEAQARSLKTHIEQARTTLHKHPHIRHPDSNADSNSHLKIFCAVMDKVIKWYDEIYVHHSPYVDLGVYLGLDSLPKDEGGYFKPRTPTTAGIAGSSSTGEH